MGKGSGSVPAKGTRNLSSGPSPRQILLLPRGAVSETALTIEFQLRKVIGAILFLLGSCFLIFSLSIFQIIRPKLLLSVVIHVLSGKTVLYFVLIDCRNVTHLLFLDLMYIFPWHYCTCSCCSPNHVVMKQELS